MCDSTVFMLDPTAKDKIQGARLAERQDDLRGSTVGFIDNGWWSFGVVLERYKSLLKQRYGVSDVLYVNREKEGIQNGRKPQQLIEELASKVDVVITGLGN